MRDMSDTRRAFGKPIRELIVFETFEDEAAAVRSVASAVKASRRPGVVNYFSSGQ